MRELAEAALRRPRLTLILLAAATFCFAVGALLFLPALIRAGGSPSAPP